MTSRELAELNKMKAETGQILMTSGAIDGNDERQRLIVDPESGYNGMIDDQIEEENEELNSQNKEFVEEEPDED